MYTHEFKTALIQRLSAIPEILQVNYLQYWGEQIYFMLIDPRNDATEQSANDALQKLLDEVKPRKRPNVRLRFIAFGEHLPSSTTLYRKATPVIA